MINIEIPIQYNNNAITAATGVEMSLPNPIISYDNDVDVFFLLTKWRTGSLK